MYGTCPAGMWESWAEAAAWYRNPYKMSKCQRHPRVKTILVIRARVTAREIPCRHQLNFAVRAFVHSVGGTQQRSNQF